MVPMDWWPFVLTSLVELVFYLVDIKNEGDWQIIQKGYCRSSYDVPLQCGIVNEEPIQSNEPYQPDEIDESNKMVLFVDLNDCIVSEDDALSQQME